MGATAIGTQGGFERERIDYIEFSRAPAGALIDSARDRAASHWIERDTLKASGVIVTDNT